MAISITRRRNEPLTGKRPGRTDGDSVEILCELVPTVLAAHLDGATRSVGERQSLQSV